MTGSMTEAVNQAPVFLGRGAGKKYKNKIQNKYKYSIIHNTRGNLLYLSTLKETKHKKRGGAWYNKKE